MNVFENEKVEISIRGFEDLEIGDIILVTIPSEKKYYYTIIKKNRNTLEIKKIKFFEMLKLKIKWAWKYIADFFNSYYCELKRSIKKWQKK